MNLLERAVHECDPWMYPVIFGSMIVLAVIIERVVTLFLRCSIRVPILLQQIEKLVRADNVDRAIKLSGVVGPQVPVGRVLRAGLKHADAGPERARLAMDAATAEAMPAVRKRIYALPAVAGATLIAGLVGSLQLGGFAPEPGLETPLPFDQPIAMAPAMAGGVVAVVAFLAFVAVLGRARRIEQDLELTRHKLLGLIADRTSRRPAEAALEARDADEDQVPRLGRLGGASRDDGSGDSSG